MTKPEYPQWVCIPCGTKYGRSDGGICTMHVGTCGVCGEKRVVTEPRDFGHLRDGWKKHKGESN